MNCHIDVKRARRKVYDAKTQTKSVGHLSKEDEVQSEAPRPSAESQRYVGVVGLRTRRGFAVLGKRASLGFIVTGHALSPRDSHIVSR